MRRTTIDDKELLYEIIEALVENPDIEIEETLHASTGTSHYLIHVDPKDRGKVIGRNGKTIEAIRTIFIAVASLQRRKVFIEVFEPRRAQSSAI
jgi:uncharacterized protein